MRLVTGRKIGVVSWPRSATTSLKLPSLTGKKHILKLCRHCNLALIVTSAKTSRLWKAKCAAAPSIRPVAATIANLGNIGNKCSIASVARLHLTCAVHSIGVRSAISQWMKRPLRLGLRAQQCHHKLHSVGVHPKHHLVGYFHDRSHNSYLNSTIFRLNGSWRLRRRWRR